jgi:RHS repeat-associated protein
MVTSIDYCKALEEINKLVCVQTTEDGWIIDPVTGYIYDPVTGLPIDLTGGGNGSGTGGGNNNQPFLDCYNKFLSFIDYYQDKENKPEEYDILVQYLSCLNGDCSTCLTLPYTKLEGRECFVDFCDLTVPDLPEEEEEEEVEIPDFPEIDLGTGVDDTWDDEEPEPTELESDPFVQRGPVWWYHSDHLGSTSYITDILGMPCQYIEYLPFGEVMVQQSTNNIFENVYKFNGKELDESTGYYYYGARYYDPAISIFLSVDPLAEQFPNWNPYTYTMNNPVNLVDPTGMAPEGREDWVYNKSEGTYHWDSTVSKPSDITNSDYEYVGASTNDVKSHYEDNNPIKSYVTNPKVGHDLNGPWLGEFTQKDITIKDEWASSEGIVGKITYGIANDSWVTLQALNPFQDRERITSIAGYGVNQSEIVDSGVNTITSLVPTGSLTKGATPLLKTMNASQFSSTFKGTILTQTSHAKRGMYNRNINSMIKAINNRYGSFRGAVKSNTETFAPIISDDMKNKKK